MTNKNIINKRSKIKGIGSFYIAYKNAVSKETKENCGISHLVEHCICEAIKPKSQELTSEGLDFNAFTSKSDVFFFLTGLDENLTKYKDYFVDSITNYIPPKDVFEREKNIVIAEYKYVMSEQASEFSMNLRKKYFNEAAPCGTLEALENITYEKFIEYLKANFSKPTHIINFSKNTYKSDIDLNTTKYKEKLSKFGIYNTYKMEKYNLENNNEYLMVFKWFDKSFWKKDIRKLVCLDILASYFSDGLNSILMREVREKLGCVYCVYSHNDANLNRGTLLSFNAQAEKSKIKLVQDTLIDCVNRNLNSLDKDYFELMKKTTKNSMKLKQLQADGIEKCKTKFNAKYKKYYSALEECDISFEFFKDVVNEVINTKYIIELSSEI